MLAGKWNPQVSLIRQVVAHVPCAACHRRYAEGDVQVLDHRERVWALAVKCRFCLAQAIIFAVIGETATHPIRTDLFPDEWTRFHNAPPLEVDDVIRFREYMENYSGDFSEIMDEPLPDE